MSAKGSMEAFAVLREEIKHLRSVNADLLEALRRCLNYLENNESEFGITLDSADAARAAIAKVEGTP